MTTMAYDAEITTITEITDPANKARRETRDGLGRLTAVVEDPGSPPANFNYMTNYAYDPLDNLTGVTQGAQTRTFQYSSLRRLKQAINPESGSTSYTYYDSGNLASRTDARGVIATFAYDGLQRILTKAYSSDPEATPAVTYTYYTTQNGATPRIGQLKSVLSAEAGSENVNYDVLGRVTRSLHGIAGSPSSYQFDYSYYLNDAIKTVAYPSGRVATSDVEDAGRISKVSGLLSSATTVYADLTVDAPSPMDLPWHYTADGRIAQMKLGNNLWETRIYQTPNLATVFRVGTGTALGNDRLELQYNFSPTQNNGNLQSQVIQRPGGTWNQTFSYDNVNRLKSITEPPAGGAGWNRSWDYDQYGNRWVVQPNGADLLPFETHEPIAASNFSTPVSGFAGNTNHLSKANSSYDAAGNQTYYAPWTLSYDAENRNVRVSSPVQGNSTTDGVGTFAYDGDGRRVRKTGRREAARSPRLPSTCITPSARWQPSTRL